MLNSNLVHLHTIPHTLPFDSAECDEHVNESANNYFFLKHRSTSDGSSTFAIVIGALAATVLLLMCVIGLLCGKRCFSYFSSINTGKRFKL